MKLKIRFLVIIFFFFPSCGVVEYAKEGKYTIPIPIFSKYF